MINHDGIYILYSNVVTSTMSVTGTIAETDPNALPLAIALG